MPRFRGFINGSYQSQSVIVDAESTTNWYPEQVESPYAENRMALYPTPGFAKFAQILTDIGARGAFSLLTSTGERCFWVIGAGFYELFSDGTYTLRGAVTNDGGTATISYNGTSGGQLLITSGLDAYSFVLASNTFAAIGALAGKANTGAMLDGYGLAFERATGTVYVSNLNDFTTWSTGTAFFMRSLRPDPWQQMAISPDGKIWMIGELTSEVWYDAGSFPVPFAPVPSAVMPFGTIAPNSVVVNDQNIQWISRTASGMGIVVSAASGYYPQRISTHATAFAFSTYQRNNTIADAEGLPYQDQDHTFTVWGFPSALKTWCYDPLTNLWHNRGRWNVARGDYDLWTPRCHTYAFNRHLIGDRASGIIATQDVAIATELDGAGIRRQRIAPGLIDEHRYVAYSRLELLLETGLGTQTGQGADPQVMLSYSDDGGHTYGNERIAGAGRVGEFRRQVYWDLLGISRHRVFKVSVTDPIVNWRVADAFINNTSGRQAA